MSGQPYLAAWAATRDDAQPTTLGISTLVLRAATGHAYGVGAVAHTPVTLRQSPVPPVPLVLSLHR